MFSVAVLGQDGLFHRRAGKVLMEDLIHYLGDAVKNVPVGDPLVVIGSGSSNGKIITFVAVPLRVDPVQGKRLDRQHIGLNGCSGPGGIYFAAGNIFLYNLCTLHSNLWHGNPWVVRRGLLHIQG